MWLEKNSRILGIPFIVDSREFKDYRENQEERENIFNLLFKSKDNIAEISKVMLNELKRDVVFKPRSPKDPKYLLDPEREKIVVTLDENHRDTREILSFAHFIFMYFLKLYKKRDYDLFILPWIADALASVMVLMNKKPISNEEIKREIFLYTITYYYNKIFKTVDIDNIVAAANLVGYKLSYSLYNKTKEIQEKVKTKDSDEFLNLLVDNLYTTRNNLFSFVIRYGNDYFCAFDEPAYLVSIIILDNFFSLFQINRYLRPKCLHRILNYFSNYAHFV